MTLLSIVQDAADEIGASVRPTSVIGNGDPDAQRFLRLANKVGEFLMKRAVWQVLRKERTFTAVAGEEQTGILPSDFDRFITETFWDRTDKFLLSGPVSPTRWQAAKTNNYDDPARLFILRGGGVYVLPAFDGGESLAFEYVSNEWCQSSGSVGQSAWAADTDTGVIDEELITLGLIFEYTHAQGLPTAVTAWEAFNRRFDRLQDNDQPDSTVVPAADIFGGGRHFTGDPPANSSGSVVY